MTPVRTVLFSVLVLGACSTPDPWPRIALPDDEPSYAAALGTWLVDASDRLPPDLPNGKADLRRIFRNSENIAGLRFATPTGTVGTEFRVVSGSSMRAQVFQINQRVDAAVCYTSACRIRQGIGVGSEFTDLKRAFPDVTCAYGEHISPTLTDAFLVGGCLPCRTTELPNIRFLIAGGVQNKLPSDDELATAYIVALEWRPLPSSN